MCTNSVFNCVWKLIQRWYNIFTVLLQSWNKVGTSCIILAATRHQLCTNFVPNFARNRVNTKLIQRWRKVVIVLIQSLNKFGTKCVKLHQLCIYFIPTLYSTLYNSWYRVDTKFEVLIRKLMQGCYNLYQLGINSVSTLYHTLFFFLHQLRINVCMEVATNFIQNLNEVDTKLKRNKQTSYQLGINFVSILYPTLHKSWYKVDTKLTQNA